MTGLILPTFHGHPAKRFNIANRGGQDDFIEVNQTLGVAVLGLEIAARDGEHVLPKPRKHGEFRQQKTDLGAGLMKGVGGEHGTEPASVIRARW